MKAQLMAFGEIEIDGQRYAHDVVIDGGQIHKRAKKASKPYRAAYGHTPLSLRYSPLSRPNSYEIKIEAG